MKTNITSQSIIRNGFFRISSLNFKKNNQTSKSWNFSGLYNSSFSQETFMSENWRINNWYNSW